MQPQGRCSPQSREKGRDASQARKELRLEAACIAKVLFPFKCEICGISVNKIPQSLLLSMFACSEDMKSFWL